MTSKPDVCTLPSVRNRTQTRYQPADGGLNNKIRVLQRRAYGLRDPEYLRLKSSRALLPEI